MMVGRAHAVPCEMDADESLVHAPAYPSPSVSQLDSLSRAPWPHRGHRRRVLIVPKGVREGLMLLHMRCHKKSATSPCSLIADSAARGPIRNIASEPGVS